MTPTNKFGGLGLIGTILELETQIIAANKAYAEGNPIISDGQYDELILHLTALHPKNELLTQVWSEDSTNELDWYDVYLSTDPVKSIKLAKELNVVSNWASNITGLTKMHVSMKYDGYNWRAIYNKGKLVAAYTRGRKTKGKDITRHMGHLLPNTLDSSKLTGTKYEEYANEIDTDIIEIRGELMLSYPNLDILRAKYPRDPQAPDGGYNNPRNSVASLLKDDTPAEQINLLCPKVFRILGTSTHTLEEDYEMAELLGLMTPEWSTFDMPQSPNDRADFIEAMTIHFGTTYKDTIDYLTDGVVFTVNDKHQSTELGGDDKYDNATLAVKMHAWEAGTYITEVIDIEWSYNTKYISPVAILDPVVTDSGRTVGRIALKTIARMQEAQAYPGNLIEFEYVSDMNPRLILPGERR